MTGVTPCYAVGTTGGAHVSILAQVKCARQTYAAHVLTRLKQPMGRLDRQKYGAPAASFERARGRGGNYRSARRRTARFTEDYRPAW